MLSLSNIKTTDVIVREVSYLKKYIFPLLLFTSVIFVCSCSETSGRKNDSEYAAVYDFYEDTVSMVCEKSGITSREADRLFGMLVEKRMEKSPSSFYLMTDADGNEYYNLTSGLDVYMVYLDDGIVTKVLLYGEHFSPETESEDADAVPAETYRDYISVSEGSISLENITSPVTAGETAVLNIKGRPFTEYSVSVYYSSGKSSAKGLEPKISDEKGYVEWSWKIGAKTSPGNYKIVIAGGDEAIETVIEVVS